MGFKLSKKAIEDFEHRNGAGSVVWFGAKQNPASFTPDPAAVVMKIRPSTEEEKLNGTEKRWLERLRSVVCPEWIGIQCLTFKLGFDCRYTPDFVTIENGIFTVYEVKGGLFREDAKAKLQIAARLYPMFRWVLAVRKNNDWKISDVKT